MTPEELEQILAPPAPAQAAWCCFDHEWYLQAYPDIANKIEDVDFATVRQYYLDYGRALGHSPNMYFDETWYRLRHADIEEEVSAGEYGSGYEQYCRLGYLNRSPHWLFDNAVYTLFSPDITDHTLIEQDCVNFYDHYIKFGAADGRVAHLLFDPATYREGVEQLDKDIAMVGAESPFVDYLRVLWWDRKEVRTSIFFDPDWYIAEYRDAKTALRRGQYAGALHHYLAAPNNAGRSPLPQFSEPWYRDAYPDIASAIRAGGIVSGYDHFLRAGVFDLRSPAPGTDLHAYMQDNAEAAADIASGTCRNAFEHLLRHGPRVLPEPQQAAPAATPAPEPAITATGQIKGQGRVDFLGYHTAAGGWFFCGWVMPEHPALEGRCQVMAYFEKGRLTGPALMAPYPRADLTGKGVGLLVYMEASGRPLGSLLSLAVTGEGVVWTLFPSDNAPLLRDAGLPPSLRPVLNTVQPNEASAKIVALAARQGYTGANTLGELHDRVIMEIDETIFCPPNGVALIGWLLSATGAISSIRLVSGADSAELRPEHFLRVARPDVVANVGAQFGLMEPRSGFMLYVGNVYTPGDLNYIVVETIRGQLGFRGVPEPKQRGMEAIRFMLNRFDLRYDELVRNYDRVIGPAVASLNRERLAEPTEREVIGFGPAVNAPVLSVPDLSVPDLSVPDLSVPDLSVIVPLYGRVDFLEYQMALFSRHTPAISVEFIYVLDDPPRRRDLEVLAASVFARFGIPFRLVMLSRNLGYAPANNIGVEHARGRYVCFLNSDVMPDSDDWMERLVARLEENPDIGAVGPLLLYEDRSVQHQGMVFEPLPEFGNWLFPLHSRKGWRPEAEGGLRRVPAITGACLVIGRRRLRELGGLDESFVVGDFEDSDLCMKLAEQGLACAVDLDIALFHLERQSQAASAETWRMNLTLYNAWVHEGRWGDRLRAPGPLVRPLVRPPKPPQEIIIEQAGEQASEQEVEPAIEPMIEPATQDEPAAQIAPVEEAETEAPPAQARKRRARAKA